MTEKTVRRTILSLGQCCITPGAMDAIEQSGNNPMQYLSRHASGDWGVVCEEDKQMNDEDVVNGNRILSAYVLDNGEKIWIITEADRSATTILLPEEY